MTINFNNTEIEDILDAIFARKTNTISFPYLVQETPTKPISR
jgi:hypothetical protein